MVLDIALLTTQRYKVSVKGKVEQSKEWSNAPLHLSVVAIEKEGFGSASTKVANFSYLMVNVECWNHLIMRQQMTSNLFKN